MTLHQLICRNPQFNEEYFKKWYSHYAQREQDLKMIIESHAKVLDQLKILQPIPYDIHKNKLKITVKLIIQEFKGEIQQYYNICGKDQSTGQSYGIQFLSWAEWLGMEIDETTLTNMSQSEIIVHCIDEMTYFGMTQDEVNLQSNNIIDRLNNYSFIIQDNNEDIKIEGNKMIEELIRQSQYTWSLVYQGNQYLIQFEEDTGKPYVYIYNNVVGRYQLSDSSISEQIVSMLDINEMLEYNI